MMAELQTTLPPQSADPSIKAAKALFESEGLPFPPVSAEAAARLIESAPKLFSTRALSTSPLSIGTYVDEALKGAEPAPYTILGYAPGGVMGSAMHFYTVDEGLALFVQFSWGGSFTDAEAARALSGRVFAWAASLPEKLNALRAAGQLLAGQRLVVVLTEFGASGWGFVTGGPDVNAESALNRGGPIMTSVDAALEELAGKTSATETR